MIPLPIDRHLPEIVARVRESRCLVLVAEPGAGKTTRVPPAILAAGLLAPGHPNLVMLQPRRVAARAAAERIAEENGWEVGREVGYHVRFDKKITAQTRLRVLTEGILNRQLVENPFMEGIGAVVLDEFHERSLNTDLAIALVREVKQTVREDLILIVMSATLEAEPVAKFLGDAPIIRAEGRMFPVDISHWASPPGAIKPHLSERVAAAVETLMAPTDNADGDILVFLPGVEEIRRTARRLESLAQRENLLVLPLHGSLPPSEQTLALRPAQRRKLILATNIAETSLTIDGVRIVIDGGFARVAAHDARRGLDRLELKRISRASATQRAGRAGRTAPGRCIRLWSSAEERAMEDFELPEIRRVDLCATVLSLHAWGQNDPRRFAWYEAPPEETLIMAERLLEMLGALTLTPQPRITPLGRRLLALPLHPRLGRLMIAAAEQAMLQEGAALAALLSEKDILVRADGGARFELMSSGALQEQGDSDLLLRLELLDIAERSKFAPHLRDAGIYPMAARQIAKTRDELLRGSRRLAVAPARVASDDGTLLKLALWAYPDRVARRRANDPMRAVMVGGIGLRIGDESVVKRAEFFLALDARDDERSKTREATVRIASRIEPQWLMEMFPHEIRQERAVEYDDIRQRVAGVVRVRYRDLVLSEHPNAAIDGDQAAAALSAAARPLARGIFMADERAATWLARLAFLRQQVPEHAWPSMDDAQLGELLTGICYGKRSLDDLRREPRAALLQSQLVYPLDRQFEQYAPESITVPSGSIIRITYAMGHAPVLAVRLQELFGWTDTPRIAGGRTPIVLHLLGPNYRPVQITDDLRSFWSTTYFQVRKDLRVRYPKHSWPEDPLTAIPQAKGRRK